MIDVQSLTMPQSTNHLDSLLRQMLSSMRSTQEKPAYFHGGHAEEVFQGQLDQVLGEKLSEKTAERFAGPMFDLFMLSRS
jgi:peptidoglycan hydrolase FlgJ